MIHGGAKVFALSYDICVFPSILFSRLFQPYPNLHIIMSFSVDPNQVPQPTLSASRESGLVWGYPFTQVGPNETSIGEKTARLKAKPSQADCESADGGSRTITSPPRPLTPRKKQRPRNENENENQGISLMKTANYYLVECRWQQIRIHLHRQYCG